MLFFFGEILLLHRHPAKPEGGTWCVAGGKVDTGETPEVSARREVFEETGIRLEDIVHAGTFYVQYPTYSFVYHVYRSTLSAKPAFSLKLDEHTESRWVTPKDALTMPLIQDEDAVLTHVYGVKR